MPLIEAGFSQFVRASLFAKDARIDKIRVPDFSVVRTDQGWQLTPEVPEATDQVSADVLQQFSEIWQTASALAVRPASPEVSGEPVEITLRGSDKPIIFQIISRSPELVLVRPGYGIQYRMGNRSEAMLTLDAAAADIKD
jgi:hypothetical protein